MPEGNLGQKCGGVSENQKTHYFELEDGVVTYKA